MIVAIPREGRRRRRWSSPLPAWWGPLSPAGDAASAAPWPSSAPPSPASQRWGPPAGRGCPGWRCSCEAPQSPWTPRRGQSGIGLGEMLKMGYILVSNNSVVCVILPLTTEPTLFPAPPTTPPPHQSDTEFLLTSHTFTISFTPWPHSTGSLLHHPPPLPSSHKESLLASHPLTTFHCKHLSTKQLTCMNYPALPAALVSFHPQSPLPPVTVQLQVILKDETFIVTVINTAKVSNIHSTCNNESSVI